MKSAPGEKVSIIIVNYNTRRHLLRCLSSLHQWAAGIPQQIIVIDSASKDGSADAVKETFPGVTLISASENEGYGVAINTAARYATGTWLLFLNPDIEVQAGSLDILLSFARDHPCAGVVGPRLLYANGTPQASASRFLSSSLVLLEAFRIHLLLPTIIRSRIFLGTYFDQNRTMKVGWVSGACHLIPRATWERVGPLTEETFCGSDDYDYCYRATQQGYEVWFDAQSTMLHHCSVAVRDRWAPVEVEQLAIHNFYVVMNLHWPQWRVKIYCAAEIVSWLLETLRHRCFPRFPTSTLASAYAARLRMRLGLMVALFTGREKPRRRFEPRQRREHQDLAPTILS
jgi:N-acetylglucosaminyl-diphospho-decaprenol L-rhamnosyltransferase